MQLSAMETAAKPLPADLMPETVSRIPSIFAFRRRKAAGRLPAKIAGAPIKSTRAAGHPARTPLNDARVTPPSLSACAAIGSDL